MTTSKRLGETSGTVRRLLTAVVGFVIAVLGLALTAGPAVAGNGVGAQPIQTITTVGPPHGTAGQENAEVRGPPLHQLASTTGVAAETAGSADTIALGHYPEYVDVAKATGGRTCQVPTKVWDSRTPEQQWAANQKFLDRAVARGSNVQLATPATAAREGSFSERELQYLQSQAYTVASDGMSLIAPGGG